MTLDQLRPGRRAQIQRLEGAADLVQRLYELGLYEGELIEVLTIAPLGDPVEIRCGASRLSLRKQEAAGVHLTAIV
ncbi:MAG: ferrous iron transport protein A [Gemmataceae bacterium]